MGGQGFDKALETVKVTGLDLSDPGLEPSLSHWQALVLIENGRHLFPEGVGLVQGFRMGQQAAQAQPFVIIQGGVVLA